MAAQAPRPTFTDVTKTAGLHFVHENGAFGKKYLPETMGSGGAFLDADGDGWQDILLVNGTSWPGQPASRAVMALYRNNHDGTFTDVTAAAGLGGPDVRHGRRRRRLRQRRQRGHLRHGLGRAGCSTTSAGCKFADVTDAAQVGVARIRDERRLVRLRS